MYLRLSTDTPSMLAHARTLAVRGGYPGMWTLSGEEASKRLRNMAINYIFRDAFSPVVIYDQTILNNLLQLLAYQIGNEVNYSELSRKLGVSRETVERYIDLLEKAFIVFRLNQYRKNLRAEVGRLRKIYFINDFRPLHIREDAGSLWENFCILERRKYLSTTDRLVRSYYWRNSKKQEIDLIEDEQDVVRAFEIKYGKKEPKVPTEFTKLYPNSEYTVVNPSNFNDTLFRALPDDKISLFQGGLL